MTDTERLDALVHAIKDDSAWRRNTNANYQRQRLVDLINNDYKEPDETKTS